MIGIIVKPDQEPLVEEFFELFKTPWEFYRRGGVYDVVISTGDATPHPMPGLYISYGTDRKKNDASDVVIDRHHPGGMVMQDDGSVPIYVGLLTFKSDDPAAACLTADIGVVGIAPTIGGETSAMRVGYDLFDEMRFLLSTGQPVEHAHIPTLDRHIAMLRRWILAAGIPIVEIAPAPAGHRFAVCLTHDIDFIGIRHHKLDHTMWGFLYRSTVGAIHQAIRGRLPLRRLVKMWRAAASLPFVYLGWLKDFWEPFDWYLKTEKDLPATYYLIPFKGRPGDRASARRASRYDISDVQERAVSLVAAGCEIGVHGIDAWHDAGKGRDELARISAGTGEHTMGIRMHWLMQDANTPAVLERAGFAYDSTAGYNETVGYRNGTTQVFRPLSAQTLLELPLHIQDGALFYPQRLGLSEPEAKNRCQTLIDHARTFGGVLTVLWHDRSHGPERFWGDFYIALIQALKSGHAWFGTAADVVDWFRKRRAVRFERADDARGTSIRLRYTGAAIHPPLSVVVRRPSGARSTDIPWSGETIIDIDSILGQPQAVGSLI